MAVAYEEIESCLFSDGFKASKSTEPIWHGCACSGSDCSEFGDCFCYLMYGKNYKDGRLLKTDQESLPIYECNSCCSCDVTCPNRLVQKGPRLFLDVFDTQVKGLGLRTGEKIPEWTFVIEYVGELLTRDEARERTISLSPTDANYLLTVHEHVARSQTITTYVDATRYGNVARYINHSCEPNLVVAPVRMDCLVPRLAMFACRDIEMGEELTFDYGPGVVKASLGTISRACLCGSNRCRKVLPFDDSLFV